MPTELEELVEFLHHGNTQIRQVAAEHLVGYSTTQPSIFKSAQRAPVKDLKLLVKDYAPIARNALTILINISDDVEVLQDLIKDEAFIESLMLRITNPKEPNANEISMLFANLAKSDDVLRLLDLARSVPKDLSTSSNAMDQLLDCFVKGAEGGYNKAADFNYLSYLLADIAKHSRGRTYFTTPQKHDSEIVPLTKIQVFTTHESHIRRLGVASTLKNVSFSIPSHPALLSLPSTADPTHIGVLPYLLEPLMGPEEYSEDDTDGMFDELQLLPPGKAREADLTVIKTHIETLLLLTTTREGREELRRRKVYPIVRELHLAVEDNEIREACDRFVQVIMRDEEEEPPVKSQEDSDDDDDVVEVL